jgi:hypothetical protein
VKRRLRGWRRALELRRELLTSSDQRYWRQVVFLVWEVMKGGQDEERRDGVEGF